MPTPLRVLIVEDSPDDADHLVQHLRAAGLDLQWERVATREAMAAALARQEWDLVLSGCLLRRFGGLDALRLLHEQDVDVPFLIISSQRGEEVAVEAIRAGANDYLLKENLGRLVPVIERELREAGQRRAARQAQIDVSRLAAIVESSADAMLAMDPEGRILSWNRGAEQLYGYPAADVLGRSVSLLIPGDCAGELADILARVGRGESVPAHDTVRVRRDGSLVPVSMTASPIRDAGGEVVGISWVSRDISARKDAEERLRFLAEAGAALASSLEYEQTLERVARLAVPALADWCFVDLLDGDRIRRLAVAHSDPAKAEVASAMRRDYPARPDIPRGVAKVVRTGGPDLVPVVDDAMLREIARDEEHLALLRATGMRSFLSVPLVARGAMLGALTFGSTRPGRRYGIEDQILAEELARRAALAVDNARLYHEAVAARAAAEDANRAKDQFLAVVSHELRNPLAAIVAGTGLLRRSLPDDARTQRTAEIVERNAQHQERLVNDLLDLSRISRGTIDLRRGAVSLDAVVHRVVQDRRAEAEAAGLTLDVEATPGLCVFADPDRIQQIVANLVTNAIKFTPQGGEVRVAVAAADGSGRMGEWESGSGHPEVSPPPPLPQAPTLPFPMPGMARVTVEDTGIGIEPEMMDHLFEMFRQGETGDRRRPGLGIGLALVKSLTEMHGGRVWAESDGPGKGSRFTVELPLAPGAGE